MSDMIEHGDIVNVHFERCADIFGATVVRAAQATGDCWVIEDTTCFDPKIIYVQNFAYMEKVNE